MTKKNKVHYRLCIDFGSEEDMLEWCASGFKRTYNVRPMDTLDNMSSMTGIRYKKFLITEYADKYSEDDHPIMKGLAFSKLG